MSPKTRVTVFGGAAPDSSDDVVQELSNAEIAFATRIAHTDKKKRQRGLLFLQKWLAESQDLNVTDFVRLWRAVFYAVWLCDKYRSQLKLSVQLAMLPRSVSQTQYRGFMQAFYTVMSENWEKIDKHRVNKYFILLRVFLTESLDRLRREKWNLTMTRELVNVWTSTGGPLRCLVIPPKHEEAVECRIGHLGISLHFVRIFVHELLDVLQSVPIIPMQSTAPTAEEFLDPSSKADFVCQFRNPHIDEEELQQIKLRAAAAAEGSSIPTQRQQSTKTSKTSKTSNPSKTPKTSKASKAAETSSSGDASLPRAVADTLLDPFITYSTQGHQLPLINAIHHSIFREVVDDIVPLESFACQLFTMAASQEISQRNRSMFFDTIEELDRKLAAGGRQADYLSLLPRMTPNSTPDKSVSDSVDSGSNKSDALQKGSNKSDALQNGPNKSDALQRGSNKPDVADNTSSKSNCVDNRSNKSVDNKSNKSVDNRSNKSVDNRSNKSKSVVDKRSNKYPRKRGRQALEEDGENDSEEAPTLEVNAYVTAPRAQAKHRRVMGGDTNAKSVHFAESKCVRSFCRGKRMPRLVELCHRPNPTRGVLKSSDAGCPTQTTE